MITAGNALDLQKGDARVVHQSQEIAAPEVTQIQGIQKDREIIAQEMVRADRQQDRHITQETIRADRQQDREIITQESVRANRQDREVIAQDTVRADRPGSEPDLCPDAILTVLEKQMIDEFQG